jgi:hypothetical protein
MTTHQLIKDLCAIAAIALLCTAIGVIGGAL